jgi:hypothetical protein
MEAASKKKGMWMGGSVPLGYRVQDCKLIVVPEEAATVREIFECYLEQGSVLRLLEELRRRGIKTKRRILLDESVTGSIPFTTGPVTHLLKNRIYLGEIVHKAKAIRASRKRSLITPYSKQFKPDLPRICRSTMPNDPPPTPYCSEGSLMTPAIA